MKLFDSLAASVPVVANGIGENNDVLGESQSTLWVEDDYHSVRQAVEKFWWPSGEKCSLLIFRTIERRCLLRSSPEHVTRYFEAKTLHTVINLATVTYNKFSPDVRIFQMPECFTSNRSWAEQYISKTTVRFVNNQGGHGVLFTVLGNTNDVYDTTIDTRVPQVFALISTMR